MSLSRFALLLLLLLVLAGTGLALWRNLPISPSTAPVFSYPAAAAHFDQPGDLVPAIKSYQADRGGECKLTSADGTPLTVFYFEWDRVDVGPMMTTAGHTPDECNIALGYQLQEIGANRTYQVAGQLPLIFDSTHFVDSTGRDIFIFKLAWMQGLGSRSIREGQGGAYRAKRLMNSFIRHSGALRVLQAGVFGPRDADHAWQVFQSEVLDTLVWQ
jgi:hypothetical protein